MSMNEMGMRLTLARTKLGVILTIKTNDVIAEFVKNLGTGTKLVVDAGSGRWAPLPDAGPLEVWIAEQEQLNAIATNGRYRLDQTGKLLTIPSEMLGYPEILNLSFLRLVGADQGDGVKVLLKNYVVSTDGLVDLRGRLLTACKQVYLDYIRPCELTGEITRVRTDEVYS